MSGRRVAVLGGTFDPIHLGHISVLEQVIDLLGADEGLLVPAATPPHREAARATAAQRLEMAQAAVAGHPRLHVDDIEIVRGGSSFTVDTVTEWQRRHPGDEFHLVLGADAARLMPTWHRAADLLAMADFVVINRTGVPRVNVAEARSLGFPADRTRLLQVVSPRVSATAIRAAMAAGDTTDTMLDPAVAAVIARHHLYNGAG